MIPLKFQAVVSKVLAIGIISLLVAWWFHSYGVEQTTKLDTMAPADFAAHKREVYHVSWLTIYFGVFLFGSVYVLLVEVMAFLIRSVLPERNPFFRDETRAA